METSEAELPDNEPSRWNALQARVVEARVEATFELYRSHGIEPVLFKGWAAARMYPPGCVRKTGDIDIAVASADHGRAAELSKCDEGRVLFIDVHNEFHDLDTVPWDTLFKYSRLVPLNASEIRVPSEEDHLRLLCVHWLIDGGRIQEKLWDVYFAVANRSASFDWARCLDVVNENRRGWVICAIGLTHRYLDLDISDLPFRDDALKIPSWVSRAVEREWRRDYSLDPVLTKMHDPRRLLLQIGRRLPPNPLRAMVEADGDLFDGRRTLYQLMVLKRRMRPFLRSLRNYLWPRPDISTP